MGDCHRFSLSYFGTQIDAKLFGGSEVLVLSAEP